MEAARVGVTRGALGNLAEAPGARRRAADTESTFEKSGGPELSGATSTPLPLPMRARSRAMMRSRSRRGLAAGRFTE